jgi:hypothetical protein
MLDFNNAEDFGVKEVKIFNNGNAGIAKDVALRVDKKPDGDTSNQPDYKLYAVDANGEVNEGFYYSDDEEKFRKYQSQKLINLARGVMGNDYKFENFKSPAEALDKIMLLVKQNSVDKKYNVVVCYGTKRRPDKFLKFKSFNKFVQDVEFKQELKAENNDQMVQVTPDAAQADANPFADNIGGSEEKTDSPW